MVDEVRGRNVGLRRTSGGIANARARVIEYNTMNNRLFERRFGVGDGASEASVDVSDISHR